MYTKSTFPKTMESLKIVAIQATVSWTIFLAMYALAKMFRMPMNPALSLVGLFVGAMIYSTQREKKVPFSLTEMDHSLSMRVMLFQTAVAVTLIWAYAAMRGWINFPMAHAHRERVFVLTGIALGGTAPVSYALTRIGLRIGVKRMMQARASGA